MSFPTLGRGEENGRADLEVLPGKLQPGTPQSLLLCCATPTMALAAAGSCKGQGRNRDKQKQSGTGGDLEGQVTMRTCCPMAVISHAACDVLHSLIYI